MGTAADEERLHLWFARATFFIPLLWLLGAVVASVALPAVDRRIGFDLGITASAATTALGATASGMIALTGFVFSVTLLIVQFGTQALTPRVIPELRRDRLTGHALGVFIATFVFALGAVLSVTDDPDTGVPTASVTVTGLLLFTSVIMFLLLMQRVGTGLQLPRVLVRLGQLGVDAAASTYPEPYTEGCDGHAGHIALGERATVIHHAGRTAVIASLDLDALHAEADRTGATIELVPAIGRRIFPGDRLIRYEGGRPDHEVLLHAVILAPARTIHQDPPYALRLIVDIAIRALSPAVNDPTSAMQALNEIQLVLTELSRRSLSVGDERVRIRTSNWDDIIELALSEIALYGASSVQIPRRFRALLDELEPLVPADRLPALQRQRERLEWFVARAHGGEPDPLALASDNYGLGMARADPPRPNQTS